MVDIVGNIKSVAKTIQQIDNIELYSKILDVQQEAMNLVEDNRNLKDKVKDLEKILKTRDSLIYEGDTYWINNETNFDGPFCSGCWDVRSNLVRLHKWGDGYKCPGCDKSVFPEGRPKIKKIPYESNK